MRLPPHFYDLRPHESESDARVAAAIEAYSADPEYWDALKDADDWAEVREREKQKASEAASAKALRDRELMNPVAQKADQLRQAKWSARMQEIWEQKKEA